jgi:hypothetical protein
MRKLISLRSLYLRVKRWSLIAIRFLLSVERLLRTWSIKYTKMVAWLVAKGIKGKPSSLPGIGLELSLVSSFLVIGVGQLILVIRG